jgi:hypothetical protein
MSKSEYQKAKILIEGLEMVLHPNIIRSLKEQLGKVYAEFKKEAQEEIYSKELLQLQPLLEEYKKGLVMYYEQGSGGGPIAAKMQMKKIIETIVKLYGYKTSK